jgi:hypothetical protein
MSAYRVKIFVSASQEDLEQAMNNWFQKHEQISEVKISQNFVMAEGENSLGTMVILIYK